MLSVNLQIFLLRKLQICEVKLFILLQENYFLCSFYMLVYDF